MPSPNLISIRLQLESASNPPVASVDLNTGLQPRAWAGADMEVEVAVFGPNGACLDLSNLTQLEFGIFPFPPYNQVPGEIWTYNSYSPSPYPNLPPAPLTFVTLQSADIEATVDVDEWQAGNTEQASARFTWAQLALLELDGQPSRDFWLVIAGLTDDGRRIVYGAAKLTVYASGVEGIYLPNNLAPLVVPLGTILYVGPNQQMPFSLPIDIEGTVVVDGGVLVQS